ncbi:hypothetical protein QR680_002147 [Steinernema hermaphroditum]|uniref:Uncharacterized protein n=1 Tax=Steinernema hermaphroditum TaxID=289476 RepID=A0AA39H1H4_9BILA|nr:hypothetical protein QR680_002147 [Steinernema hermaphroditum]
MKAVAGCRPKQLNVFDLRIMRGQWSCLIHPLPALAFVAGVLLAIAVGIYGVSHKDSIVSVNDAQHEMVGSISYSFYLACGALAACIADIVVGILTVTLAQSCL